MSVRPPQILAPRRLPQAWDALQHEVVAEKAATLGRLATRLETALARLEAFEAAGPGEAGSAERASLLDAAGEALWHFVIQRELCGFRNSEDVMRAYRVPAAVRARMGIRPPVRQP
ncbi:DUF6665 family protein [Faunimonas sp. B44]|uniref:DUF6665 family protein n=1 Tax=Faunimonas sp. B44 TaxID=3461493 RepID=UPI004044C72F